ncbi:GMC oxidoreductase [Mycena venus]|uniref:GMC oxidoreductase n=1 Tax=Mycena venus TaxID=2733690 RepID=A0A8H7DC25_9AGAR|nr:GMC oxidoreductase [Mycena venus]
MKFLLNGIAPILVRSLRKGPPTLHGSASTAKHWLRIISAIHLPAEVAFSPGTILGSSSSNSIAAGMVVLHPVSHGSVIINSSNPFDSPVIDVRFYQEDIDIFTAREAVKKVLKFAEAPTWKDYIIAPTVDLENLSEADLDDYIRNTTASAVHLVGTAAMSAKDARYGVVDPDLLVKGASRLRIIDASVFPFVVSGHATYAIAERGADLVKEVTNGVLAPMLCWGIKRIVFCFFLKKIRHCSEVEMNVALRRRPSR